MMRARKLREQGESLDAQKYHWKDVRAALKDWKVWGLCVTGFLGSVRAIVC